MAIELLPDPERRARAAGVQSYTLIFDGNCGVCRRLAACVHRWDRHERIELIPSTRPELATRFPWLSAADYAAALQLVGPGGETWAAGAAIEHLLKVLPGGWLAGWIFRLPLGRRATNAGYRWFARNRHRLAPAAQCGVTAEDPRARRSDTWPGSPRESG